MLLEKSYVLLKPKTFLISEVVVPEKVWLKLIDCCEILLAEEGLQSQSVWKD